MDQILFKMKNKKSQITVFIILGIVIVLTVVVGLLFYYRSKQVAETIIFEDVSPVQLYVDTCLKRVSTDAINLVGAQAGYVEIPENIARYPKKYLALDSGGLFKIPIWGSEIQGFSSPPTPSEIEAQMRDYVEKNVKSCIGDFGDLKKAFVIQELKNLSIEVHIQDSDILFKMEYPLRIINKGLDKERKISKFGVLQPVRLKRVLEYAKQVIEKENNEKFLEKITFDIMAAGDEIPLDGVEMKCGHKKWYLKDIREKLQSYMTEILPEIRFEDTNYAPFLAEDSVYLYFKNFTLEDFIEGRKPQGTKPADAYYYNHLLIDASDNDYKDLVATVDYKPEYGMDVYARPSKGGVLSTSQMKGDRKWLRYICVNVYHFTYDVLYPVVISINDPQSFNGDGFIFKFAVAVSIDHNEPNKGVIDTSLFDIYQREERPCDFLGDEDYAIRAYSISENDYLKDVNISFDCVLFECLLGQTTVSPRGSVFELVTKVPRNCVGGWVVAEKEGYIESRRQLIEDTVDIPMIKIKKFKIKPKIHYLMDYNSVNYGPGQEIGGNVTLSLMIENNKIDHMSIAAWTPFNESGLSYIEFIDNTTSYNIMALLYDNEDDILLAGYLGDFNYSYTEMTGKNEIELHLVGPWYKPLTEDEQMTLNMYLFNGTYVNALRPRFK